MNKIHSFDPYLLEDQLLQTLQRSPQTQKYTQMRVQQIIVDLLSTPAIDALRKQIQSLTDALQKSELDYEGLLQQSKQQNEKAAHQLALTTKDKEHLQGERIQRQKFQKISLQLQAQLKAMIQTNQMNEKEIDQMKEKVEQLQNLQAQLHQQITEKEKIIESLSQELEQLKGQHKIFSENKQMEGDQFLKEIQKLQHEKKTLKNQFSITRANEIKLKKQLQSIIKKHQSLHKDHSQTQQTLKQEVSLRENERKAINFKLITVTNKCKLQTRCIGKLKKQFQGLRILREELKLVRKIVIGFFMKIKSSMEEDYVSILDEIGFKMSKQLEDLMMKITKQGNELKLYKETLKVKDQIIEKLEKLSDTQTTGNKELKSELKVKKREADLLRKQLKRNYEETEIKLVTMEKAYKDILIDSRNLRY